MSERYTKFNSNYLMRSQHQKTDNGSILERDWVTTNGLNVLRFGSGRKIWYNSGNFVFTTSNIPSYHKKHKLSTEVNEWKWDDCKNADGTTNEIKPSYTSTDLRDYAYYGSCVELIRATVEDIISDFPGCLKSTTQSPLDSVYKEGVAVNGYLIRNQFNIDLHHEKITLGKYDNEMRFMSHSWKKYCVVKNDGTEEELVSFTINNTTDFNNNCLNDNEGKVIKTIIIETSSGTYTIYAYYLNRKIQYIYRGSEIISIQPKEEYLEEYFNNLSGFKGQMLRRDTKPYYSNRFVTPIEQNFKWYYPERTYVWPSDGYCIDINSAAFEEYIGKLFDIAQIFDDMWTDNLYRSMTHESIKNFDWTYSRQYAEGDEQNNIDGGERMQKIIRVFGRVFDDVKIYIDSIKNITNITYDTKKNMPDALLSDKCDLAGIDIKSTIGQNYDIDASIGESFLSTVEKNKCWINENESNHKKWYSTRNSTDIYPDICDNEFMRRLSLSAKRVMQTKGTQESIEMIMGLFGFGRDADYEIDELAYYTGKLIKYDDCVNGSEGVGINWNDVASRKKGELAQEINANKDLDLLYYDEDPLSGIPMRTVLLGRENTAYLVPFYDSTQMYDGDLIYQCKGGWGKFIKETKSVEDCFKYQETLSYLHVVGTIRDMLTVNPNNVENNTIYYVSDLSDYTQYDENPPMDIENNVTMSHYFILIDVTNTSKLSSWKNIIVKTELENGELQDVEERNFNSIYGNDWSYDDGTLSSYKYAFMKMHYLDNILSTNIANNPHVGYGNYDDGNTFIEYMKLPFKYIIEHSEVMNNDSLMELANLYKFDDIGKNEIKDKIQIMNSRKDGKSDFIEYSISGGNIIKSNANTDNSSNTEKRWYINTKVLTITNKLDSDKYRSYFKSVIMPYLMQVIPSTTILILKNFD